MIKKFLFAVVCIALVSFKADAQSTSIISKTIITSGTSDLLVLSGASDKRILLCGFSATETTGTDVASGILRHGTTIAGPQFYSKVTLLANESAREGPGNCDRGILAGDGVFLERVTGSSEWVIYTRRF
jgi:hypothetical protein